MPDTLVTNAVLTARVGINGQNFLFFRWPESQWIAHVDMMVRDEEGVSAYEPAEGTR